MPVNPVSLDSIATYKGQDEVREIRFGEKPNYTEATTREGIEAHRTLYCNWSDARDFPIMLLGDVQPDGSDNLGLLKRITPHPHPHGSKMLYAVQADLVNAAGGFYKNPNDGLIGFSDRINNLDGLAEWSVVYRNLPFDVREDLAGPARDGGVTELYRYVERDVKFAMEGYPVPGLAFQWQSDGKPFPEPFTMRRPLQELKYTWHWVPEPLPKVLGASEANPNDEIVVGRLNAALFDPGSWLHRPGYPPGHLLCTEPVISGRFWTPSGKPVRNIIYSLLYRADSRWDAFWKQSLGRFDPLQASNFTVVPAQQLRGAVVAGLKQGKGRRPYEPGNFLALFGYR
jgi:hypothetical protein